MWLIRLEEQQSGGTSHGAEEQIVQLLSEQQWGEVGGMAVTEYYMLQGDLKIRQMAVIGFTKSNKECFSNLYSLRH